MKKQIMSVLSKYYPNFANIEKVADEILLLVPQKQNTTIHGYQPKDDIDTSNPPQEQIAKEILKKHLINTKWGDADELERELNENKDQVEAIVEAMKEYNQINLVDFTDWLKWALFHNPDEDDSQTLVNEYLKHNS